MGLVLGIDPHHPLGTPQAGIGDECPHGCQVALPVEAVAGLALSEPGQSQLRRQIPHEGSHPGLPDLISLEIPGQAIETAGTTQPTLLGHPTHGLHGISQPTPGLRLIPGAWAEARPGADVMAQELNAFLQRATGQGVALGGEFLVQPAQGPTHGSEDVGILVQIGKGAREALPGASAQVAAGPLGPFDPPARASPRFGPLDETPLEVM